MDELAAAVDGFTLDVVAERCQLDPDDIVAAARMFAAGPKGTAGTGTGPNMAAHSSLTEHLVVVLNTILGRVNREGDLLENGLLLYPETPHRAQVTPPRAPANGPPSRIRGLRGYRGEMPTAALAEEILTPGEGRIRALIVSGGNPAVAFPDQELTLRGARRPRTARGHRSPDDAHRRVRRLRDRADAVAGTGRRPPPDGPVVPPALHQLHRAGRRARRRRAQRVGGLLGAGVAPRERAAAARAVRPTCPCGPTPTRSSIGRYAGSRMPLDEVRANRAQVHPHLQSGRPTRRRGRAGEVHAGTR